MNRVTFEICCDTEIVVADFTDCKEARMIEILLELRTRIIEGGKPQPILAIFNDRSYFTAGFVSAFKNAKRIEAIPFISKQAVIGLSETKKMIVTGMNLFFNRNIRTFSSREEAIEYLVSE